MVLLALDVNAPAVGNIVPFNVKGIKLRIRSRIVIWHVTNIDRFGVLINQEKSGPASGGAVGVIVGDEVRTVNGLKIYLESKTVANLFGLANGYIEIRFCPEVFFPTLFTPSFN